MDHKTAKTLQAAERYSLDELSDQEREQFEEHLFDCPVCSEQVRQNFTVTENLKQVFREGSLEAAHAAPAGRGGWQEWLRLPSLVPTFAALALAGFVVYQSANPGASETTAHVLPAASLLMPVSRGEAVPVQLIDPRSASLLLTFSVDALHPDSFLCEFKSAAGKEILRVTTGPETAASFNLPIQVPARLFPAGRYQMILRPVSEPDSIKSYPFVLENSK